MASFRSWIGSLASLLAFVLVRRYTVGLAAPMLSAIVVGGLFAWFLLLRVPELAQPFADATVARKQALAEAAEVAAAEEVAKAVVATAGVVPAKDVSAVPPVVSTHDMANGEAVNDSVTLASQSTMNGGAVPLEHASAPAQPSAPAQRPEAVSGGAVSSDALPAPVVQDTGAGPSGVAQTAAVPAPDNLAAESAVVDTSSTAVPATASAPVVPAPTGGVDNSDEESEESVPCQEPEAGVPDESHVNPEEAATLRQQGNDFFKSGKAHLAREAYSEALFLTPSQDTQGRAALFSNRAACHQKEERWEDVVQDCGEAIKLDDAYVKAYLRRSNAFEQQKRWHDAAEDLKKAIELDSSLRSREERRLKVLEKRATEQFEKDKDEMMGKLKDLGNTVLGKFGMSCDNFKMEQDPATGSYSMKYAA